MSVDAFGRPLRDVRISVTDRCNFRCTYCMPRAAFASGHAFLPREHTMTDEDIALLGSILVRLGVTKIRITGGEPLLRPDIARIVGRLASTGVEDLALTTNGSLLQRWAGRLRDAGLGRITVSLDSLDATVHARMSDSAVPLATVLAGIDSARREGMQPLKLNAVVRRGVNDASILPLVEYARENGHTLRFIEYMDVGESNAWNRRDVVTAAEILDTVRAVHPLTAVPARSAGDVARRYRYDDGGGELGVIASVTEPFCGGCTRLRVSADGRLHTCLFSSAGVDLLPSLRARDDVAVADVVTAAWSRRRDRYSELRASGVQAGRRLEMSYMGG